MNDDRKTPESSEPDSPQEGTDPPPTYEPALSDAGYRKAAKALADKAMKQYRVALDKLADL